MQVSMVIAVCLLLAAPLRARGAEHTYTADLTDFSIVESIKGLLDGKPIAEGLGNSRLGISSIDVVKLFKSKGIGFYVYADPSWQAVPSDTKPSGKYIVCLWMRRTWGPLDRLDYKATLTPGKGASVNWHSEFDIVIRKFIGPLRGGDDPLLYVLANIPRIHAKIEHGAECGVLAAERAMVWGYAHADHARRDRERAERVKANKAKTDNAANAKAGATAEATDEPGTGSVVP